MQQTQRKFDREFREGAVSIASETGKSVVQLARDLRISATTWAIGLPRTALNAKATQGLSTGGSDELKRLRNRGRLASDGS